MRRFEGRTVVVTGASRGLGRAIATAFAREGAHVFVGFHRHAAEADATARLAAEAGGSAEPLAIDVTRAEEVERAFAHVRSTRGRLDVLVNNAATVRDAFVTMLDDASWAEVLATNLDGALRCVRAAAPMMLHAKSGAIVNVASVSGTRASPGQAAYSASKGGLLALSRTLAAELAPKGIRVNSVVPGLLDVGMAARMGRRQLDARAAQVPAGRLGRGDEVAGAVLFLASDAASYVYGAELAVDGGLSL